MYAFYHSVYLNGIRYYWWHDSILYVVKGRTLNHQSFFYYIIQHLFIIQQLCLFNCLRGIFQNAFRKNDGPELVPNGPQEISPAIKPRLRLSVPLYGRHLRKWRTESRLEHPPGAVRRFGGLRMESVYIKPWIKNSRNPLKCSKPCLENN